MRRSRDAGGSRKWNRHAERGVGGEGKLNRRADPMDGAINRYIG